MQKTINGISSFRYHFFLKNSHFLRSNAYLATKRASKIPFRQKTGAIRSNF